jgi:hypothetical protein
MSPRASTEAGNSSALPTEAILGWNPCWEACFQKGRPVGRDGHAGDDLGVGRLELGDLGGEVLGAVLVAARVDDLVALLGEDRREAQLLVAPGVAVAVVGPQRRHHLVVADLAPHVGEHRDDVLKAPEEVVGPGERLLGVALAAEEPRLPGGDAGDAGDAVGLALVGHWVGRLWGGGDQHQVDLVGVDEVAGDGGGPVGVGLAVLGDDLHRVGGAADHQAALQGLAHPPEDEVVGLAEAGQGAGPGGDVADLEGPGGVGARLRLLAAGQGRGSREPGELHEPAAIDATATAHERPPGS